jgi:hypothetical protein
MRRLTTRLDNVATVITRSAWFGTLLLPLTTAQYLCAQTIFNDGGVHNITTTLASPVDVLAGSNGATTLNILPGASVSGGSISGDGTAYGINAEDGGIVNISSGSISAGNAVDLGSTLCAGTTGGTVNVSGGNFAVGNVSDGNGSYGVGTNGGGVVNISGGNFALGTVSGGGGSFGVVAYGGTIDISDCNISGGSGQPGGGPCDIGAYYGTVDITGGSFSGGSGGACTVLNLGGEINIYGGSFSDGTGPSTFGIDAEGGTIDLFGRSFSSGFGPISVLSGTLSGTLEDGHSLALTFYQDAPGEIVLVSTPEPSTLALLAAGTFCLVGYRLRRRKARNPNPSTINPDAPAILSFRSRSSANVARRAA